MSIDLREALESSASIDVRAERAKFETWWRMWCPGAEIPSGASHIFDAWLARARQALASIPVNKDEVEADHPLARMVADDEAIEAEHPGWMTGEATPSDQPATGDGVEDVVERAFRAGFDVGEQWGDDDLYLRGGRTREGEIGAGLAELRAALASTAVVPDGMVMVPREPTEAMIRALDKGLHDKWPNARAMALAAWEAMLLASKDTRP